MAVLQCVLRAEVKIVGDDRRDVLWSGIAAVGDCSNRMELEEGVSCVVDCGEITEICGTCCCFVVNRIVFFPVPARKKQDPLDRVIF